MQIRNYKTVLGFIGAVILLWGCSTDSGNTSGSIASGSNYVVKPNTKVFTTQNAQIVNQTDKTISVKGYSDSVTVGNIIVSTLGSGLLGKVTKVTRTGDVLTLETTPTSLKEAFETYHFALDKALSKSDLGNLSSNDPAVELVWDQSRSRSTTLPSMTVNFKKLALSAGISLGGSANFSINPKFDFELTKLSGSSDKVLTFEASISPFYSHNLTLTSEFGGSLSGSLHKKIPLGTYYVLNPPVAVNVSLDVSSSISGTASGAVEVIYTSTVGGTLGISKGVDKQIKLLKNLNVNQSGEFSRVEAGLGFHATPIKLGLTFKLYNLVGPYFNISADGDLSGAYEENSLTGEQGIRAILEAGINGGVGIDGPDLKIKKDVLDIETSLVDYPFAISDKLELFNKFFPFQSKGNIEVIDNGSARDDIFEVALDNVVLGRTTKGFSGQFRVGAIAPGNHTLRITTIEDDNPPGTWGISLNNGLTFVDGSTVKVGELSLGASQSFTIVVPKGGATKAYHKSAIPRNSRAER
jgi:hypothetical protein